jgi:hypothetical protein
VPARPTLYAVRSFWLLGEMGPERRQTVKPDACASPRSAASGLTVCRHPGGGFSSIQGQMWALARPLPEGGKKNAPAIGVVLLPRR